MGAFSAGFSQGRGIANDAMSRERQEKLDAQNTEKWNLEKEQIGLRTDELRREASRQSDMAGVRAEIGDYRQGINRPATNAALDADFDAADAASAQGLALPAMRGGSNMENAKALEVKTAVDPTSREFRGGMAGLRSRYALASGNMADFDAVEAAELTRTKAAGEADFAMQIGKDPTGQEAVSARAWINKNSRTLSTKVDPKTGATIFAAVKGDGYDEHRVRPDQLGAVGIGMRRLLDGDPSGLALIAGVNKDLAATVAEELNMDFKIGTANDESSSRARTATEQARSNQARENLQAREVKGREADREAANWRTEQYVDDKGAVRTFDVNSKNPGAPDYRERRMPEGGLKPYNPRAKMTEFESRQIDLKMVEAGMSPMQIAIAKGAYGQDPMAALGSNLPGAPGAPGAADKPAPAASPARPEPKYIRETAPRSAGYVYKESPRGLTKAQYAEIDRKRTAAEQR